MIRQRHVPADTIAHRLLPRHHSISTFPLKCHRELHSNNASRQRAQLLQAHGVLRCRCEVLLRAEGDDAVVYAEAAYVAASLVNKSVEELDSVHFR